LEALLLTKGTIMNDVSAFISVRKYVSLDFKLHGLDFGSEIKKRVHFESSLTGWRYQLITKVIPEVIELLSLSTSPLARKLGQEFAIDVQLCPNEELHLLFDLALRLNRNVEWLPRI